MGFKRDIDGIQVELDIRGYIHPMDKNDYNWCDCGYRFVAGTYLNYYVDSDETLESGEIEGLHAELNKLLIGEKHEDSEVSFIEPDFIFELHCKKDARDVEVVWKVYFWNEGLTENYLAITLNREDVESLRDYLKLVISQGV